MTTYAVFPEIAKPSDEEGKARISSESITCASSKADFGGEVPFYVSAYRLPICSGFATSFRPRKWFLPV
jgi:hypothetical protein